MANIKFTAPTGETIEISPSSGSMYLHGYFFSVGGNGYEAPSDALLFRHPPSLIHHFMHQGNLYGRQGTIMHLNSSSFPGSFIIRNSIGSPVLSIDYDVNEEHIYLKGSWINIGSPVAPTYDPSKWNDDGPIQRYNGCYNYATDMMSNSLAVPGHAACSTLAQNSNDGMAGMRLAAMADGSASAIFSQSGINCMEWKGTTSPSEPTDGRHIVALAVRPSPECHKAHWYRKDAGGSKWSHKDGTSPVTDKDASSQTIYDVMNCDRGLYTSFIGFFYASGRNSFII